MWQYQPYICFVDIISVLERSERITQGIDLIHPLYPVGYPALLSVVSSGWKLLLAKMLAIGSAMWLLTIAMREMSWQAGLGLLCCGVWSQWGATEGTDIVAGALSVIALLYSKERPLLAGILIAAACMTRYTALIALPLVLWSSQQRLQSLIAVVFLTFPHWGLALWQGVPWFDQGENFLPESRNVRGTDFVHGDRYGLVEVVLKLAWARSVERGEMRSVKREGGCAAGLGPTAGDGETSFRALDTSARARSARDLHMA